MNTIQFDYDLNNKSFVNVISSPIASLHYLRVTSYKNDIQIEQTIEKKLAY